MIEHFKDLVLLNLSLFSQAYRPRLMKSNSCEEISDYDYGYFINRRNLGAFDPRSSWELSWNSFFA